VRRMDEIDALIRKMKEDERIKRTRFTSTIINELGRIYEIYGYGAAKAFLIDKLRNKRKEKEVRTLLRILDEINDMNYPREIGSFIIRKINSLKVEW